MPVFEIAVIEQNWVQIPCQIRFTQVTNDLESTFFFSSDKITFNLFVLELHSPYLPYSIITFFFTSILHTLKVSGISVKLNCMQCKQSDFV